MMCATPYLTHTVLYNQTIRLSALSTDAKGNFREETHERGQRESGKEAGLSLKTEHF